MENLLYFISIFLIAMHPNSGICDSHFDGHQGTWCWQTQWQSKPEVRFTEVNGLHQSCFQGGASSLCTVQSENIGQQSSEVSASMCVGVSIQHIHISCFILSLYLSFPYNLTFPILRDQYSHTPVAQKMNSCPELVIALFLMFGKWNGRLSFCLVS